MDPKRLTVVKKTIYWQEMNIAAQACIARAEKMGMSFSELSYRADLSHSTVARLYHGITGYPQWMTLWKLCQAVGLRLDPADRSAPSKKMVQSSLPELRKAFGRKPRPKKPESTKKKGKGS